jgi:hypothetical protein
MRRHYPSSGLAISAGFSVGEADRRGRESSAWLKIEEKSKGRCSGDRLENLEWQNEEPHYGAESREPADHRDLNARSALGGVCEVERP